MASFKNTALAAFLLASGVTAQSTISFETCDDTASAGAKGNKFTTCKSKKIAPTFVLRCQSTRTDNCDIFSA